MSNILWRDPSGWLDLGKENPRLGRRGTREMETAPQPRERRIKAGKTVTRVRAEQGENLFLPYTMESRQGTDTIYCLNYTVNIEPSLRSPKTADY